MSIENGKTVSLEYTVSVDGQQVESNKGSAPLVYTHGAKQIVPGLEKELTGLDVGSSKSVTVPPEQAYGEVNDQAFVEVKKEQVPEEARQVGAQLMTKDPQGNTLHPVVSEVREESVVLDFNHPLAGKTLQFDVTVVSVE